jgi:hypothetical protein
MPQVPAMAKCGLRPGPTTSAGGTRAPWGDINCATTHCTKVERIALVGDERWEKGMAAVCKPFTKAKVRYFDASEMESARAWIAGA